MLGGYTQMGVNMETQAGGRSMWVQYNGIVVTEKDYNGTEVFTQETGYTLRDPQGWRI